MTWNHRVMRREYPEQAMEEDRVQYGIHEVYYDADGKPEMHTQEPTRISEMSLDQLRSTVGRIALALAKPVLDFETRQEIR